MTQDQRIDEVTRILRKSDAEFCSLIAEKFQQFKEDAIERELRSSPRSKRRRKKIVKFTNDASRLTKSFNALDPILQRAIKVDMPDGFLEFLDGLPKKFAIVRSLGRAKRGGARRSVYDRVLAAAYAHEILIAAKRSPTTTRGSVWSQVAQVVHGGDLEAEDFQYACRDVKRLLNSGDVISA